MNLYSNNLKNYKKMQIKIKIKIFSANWIKKNNLKLNKKIFNKIIISNNKIKINNNKINKILFLSNIKISNSKIEILKCNSWISEKNNQALIWWIVNCWKNHKE